jgi:hypothetical protein
VTSESNRGKIGGIPSAAILFGILAVIAILILGWSLFQGSAPVLVSSLDLNGQPTQLSVISNANIRDRPTSKGSQIIGTLNPGDTVDGVVEQGEVTGFFWLRLNNSAGYVSTVNLGVNAQSQLQTVRSTQPSRSLSFRSVGGFDSYIRSSVPSALWAEEATIMVGGWGDEYRGLIRFNIDNIPQIVEGSSIKLRIYARSPDDGTAFRPTAMAVYQAASSFSANTSWQSQPSIDRNTERVVDVSSEGWLDIDITNVVASWQKGAPNNGIVLVPLNKNNKFNMFVSSDDTARQQFWPMIEINP